MTNRVIRLNCWLDRPGGQLGDVYVVAREIVCLVQKTTSNRIVYTEIMLTTGLLFNVQETPKHILQYLTEGEP